MMILLWIILVCIGIDPITSFFVSLVGAGILNIMQDDEPKVVNNYYYGGENDYGTDSED